MSIDNRTKPDANSSARLLRTQLKGAQTAKAIKTTGSLTNTSVNNESEPSPVEKVFEDSFLSKLDKTKQARQDQIKKQLFETSRKGDNYAQEQHKAANNAAEALVAYVAGKTHPEGLKKLQKKDSEGNQVNQSPEELEESLSSFIDEPEQIGYIAKNSITADLEAKRKEFQDDPDKLAELEAKEAALAPFFSALSALGGNGSHEEMFTAIEGLNKQDMTPQLKKLVKNYMNSLVEVGRAQQYHLGITLQNENSFLKVAGVNPRVDKREYRRLYARLGGMISDRNGGITGAGQMYNFKDADIVHAGDPYEYKLGEETDLDVRRLVDRLIQPAQNRTYTGVALSEENPSPRYVYVDSEIPINGDLPFDNPTQNA